MRTLVGSIVATAIAMVVGVGQVNAIPSEAVCDVCTCSDGAIICIAPDLEVLEEQGVCGGACDAIGADFVSRDIVQVACDDLPACDHAQTPAASPLWLGISALGMVLFGAASLRRLRSTTQH